MTALPVCKPTEAISSKVVFLGVGCNAVMCAVEWSDLDFSPILYRDCLSTFSYCCVFPLTVLSHVLVTRRQEFNFVSLFRDKCSIPTGQTKMKYI